MIVMVIVSLTQQPGCLPVRAYQKLLCQRIEVLKLVVTWQQRFVISALVLIFYVEKLITFIKIHQKAKFPRTPAGIVKPGERLDRDGNVIETRDDIGVYNDFGYVPVNNFYQLPGYEDTAEFSYPNLLYYQPRWCKHIYAAMWSIVHDEGNNPINLTGRYEQSGGPNITVNAENHQLGVNTRIQLEFTSGNAISGEYTVSQVIDDNNFVIIYPFTQTTSGYCQVQNLKNHEYVGAWLLDLIDQPIGECN